MYQLADDRWIRPELVLTVEIYDNINIAYVGFPSREVTCKPAEARALLEHLNGLYNDAPTSPAADVVQASRHVTSVRMFISRSGNESWEGMADDAVVYFRQVQAPLLKEAGLWEQLNRMTVGDTCEADITVYTVPDGDLHKIVAIDPGGTVTPDEPDPVSTYIYPHIDPLELDDDDDDSDGLGISEDMLDAMDEIADLDAIEVDLGVEEAGGYDPLDDDDDDRMCCPSCGRMGWFDVGDTGEPDYDEINICPDCGERFFDDDARRCE